MKRHKSSRHRKRSAMRITHPLSIQEKPEAVSRKSHNIKKQNRKRNNCRCGSCGQEGRKEKRKKTNYQLPFVWTKDASTNLSAQPYHLIIYQKCPSSILSRPPPGKIRFREGREQRRYAIQKIRIISIIMRKWLDRGRKQEKPWVVTPCYCI